MRETSRARSRFAFLVIFFACGFTALLYQTAWQRILTLFGGADVYSVTIVVAAFMAGLGFGHIAGGHVADQLEPRARLTMFAACELVVAAFAAASATLYYDLLYVRFGGLDLSHLMLALIVFVVTLVPTFFMGMSLPLAARALGDGESDAGRWVPLLYGWNTLGAAAGAFVSVTLLFRTTDLRGMLLVGAAISSSCGLAAILLAPALVRRFVADKDGHIGSMPITTTPAPVDRHTDVGMFTWVVVYALSGFVALSLEIVWFRVLGVIMKSNAFTFGYLLTVYLGGVGVGALAGHSHWRRTRHPGPMFLLVQAAIPVVSVLMLAAFVVSVDRIEWARPLWDYMASYDPLTRGDLGLSGGSSAGRSAGLAVFIATYLVLPTVLIGPPTIMMGATFALLQRAVQTDVGLLGRRVGWLQAANVVGATFGALITGLWLLERLGSIGTLRLLTSMSLAYLWLYARSVPGGARWRLAIGLAIVVLTSASLPSSTTFWARLHGAAPGAVIQREDGSGLSLLKEVDQSRVLVFANGLGQSVLPYGGVHTALGALPVLIHPNPRSIAVIGLASGDTLFATGGRRETTTIDSIEIIAPEFATLHELLRRDGVYPALRMLLMDTRIAFHVADGRAFVRKGSRRYDVIEADALRPTSAFAGNLYSVEYFEMVREHLEPGGFAVSWSPTERVRDSMLLAFPHLTLFGDVAVGSNRPIDSTIERVRQRLSDPFTSRYFQQGGIDIAGVLAPYLDNAPVVFGPELDRRQLTDVNRDLFPKDEFVVPYVGRWR